MLSLFALPLWLAAMAAAPGRSRRPPQRRAARRSAAKLCLDRQIRRDAGNVSRVLLVNRGRERFPPRLTVKARWEGC